LLTARVQSPDEDDCKKLKIILKYLNETRNLKLTLHADQTKYAVHWYVDGSHQIHEDCRGQTSSLATFCKGAVSSSLNKMKCNTKSTETELISFAHILTDIIWMHYFVKCQGCNINKYIVFQDNMSALLLERMIDCHPPNVPNILRQNIFSLKTTMMLEQSTLSSAQPTRCGLMY
jgi:hypothetical protein